MYIRNCGVRGVQCLRPNQCPPSHQNLACRAPQWTRPCTAPFGSPLHRTGACQHGPLTSNRLPFCWNFLGGASGVHFQVHRKACRENRPHEIVASSTLYCLLRLECQRGRWCLISACPMRAMGCNHSEDPFQNDLVLCGPSTVVFDAIGPVGPGCKLELITHMSQRRF